MLTGLFLLLTFEGMVRKLEPGIIGTLVFFIKDAVILYLGFLLVRRHKLPAGINHLFVAYILLIVLLLPNILVTFSHDPLLSVFGAKEYLLYPIVALATFAAFQDAAIPQLISFCRIIALLMVPTGVLAIIQTQLPASSWINMSVDGASLDAFSSAGHLRVSATFSFVAQFCVFLNMQIYMVILALHHFKDVKNKLLRLALLSTLPLLVISSYLTGSRGAVLADFVVLAIALGLAFVRMEFGKVWRFVAVGAAIAGIALLFQAFFPTLMATYSVREKGHVFGVSSEIQDRVFQAFTGWTADIDRVPFFGNGLGIMSNGSGSLSRYAASFRDVTWTETDIASTLFEGGVYMVFVWYAFRIYIVFQTTRLFLFQTRSELFLPAAFCQADIILIGLNSTMGIQPPIAIWFWLSVGLSTIFWWRSIHPLEPAPIPPPPPRPTKTGMRPVSIIAAPVPASQPKLAGTKTVAAPTPPETKPVVAPRPIRGRSSYADRLHKQP